MKTCRKCGETKSLDEFWKAAGNKDGYRNDCRTCCLAYNHRWKQQDPAKAAQLQAEASQRYLAKVGWRKSKYGLDKDQYDALVAQQDGKCAICKQAKPLHVDHDHVTNDVRGLLCRECNIGLGNFFDKVENLLAAVEYLQGAFVQR